MQDRYLLVFATVDFTGYYLVPRDLPSDIEHNLFAAVENDPLAVGAVHDMVCNDPGYVAEHNEHIGGVLAQFRLETPYKIPDHIHVTRILEVFDH